jgi:hypothetical protein
MGLTSCRLITIAKTLARRATRVRDRHHADPANQAPLLVTWEATASNIKGIARGSLSVPVSDETLDLFSAAIQVDAEAERRALDQVTTAGRAPPDHWTHRLPY